jgi:hypothetical protein
MRDEMSRPVPPIVGVSTSHTAFVGHFSRGPIGRPVKLRNALELERTFGLDGGSEAADQVASYFANGGLVGWVVRLGRGTAWKRGIKTLDAVPPGDLSLLCFRARRRCHAHVTRMSSKPRCGTASGAGLF